MANRRNYEWPQAAAWDGFFTQDKPGGITERVDPQTVKDGLAAYGFILQGQDYLSFDTTPESVPTQTGTVSWNADEGTLDIQQPGGVTLQVGQEAQVHVTNRTGSTIGNAAAVYLTGAQGNRPTIALAEADNLPASYTIALTTQAITNNGEGYATTQGLVRGLNTSGMTEGAPVYLSDTPGVYSATPSTTRIVRLGFVVRSHATEGSIFVAIQRVENLGDLGNVTAPAPTDGQLLAFEAATGKWKPVTAAGALATATPLVESGAGAVGTSTRAAREDHVHPADGGGSGGGGGVKYASTMKAASQTANVGLTAGNVSQWAAHGVIMVPEGDLPLTQNVSKFAAICPQPVDGASFIMAVYEWPDTGTAMSLVASSAINIMPGSSSWLEVLMTSASVTLVGGRRYFFVILWNGNGATLAGTNGANLNVQPYLAFLKTNMGVLTAAPTTLTAEGELNAHFFGRVCA